MTRGRIVAGGYGHGVVKIGPDHYRLSWSFDTKIAGSRLRWPRTITRDTDQQGAQRFVAKWDVPAYRAADLLTAPNEKAARPS